MNSSYRQIMRSSSIIGGASVANILVGLARMKVAAVLLGPAGVGLIGLMQSLVQASSTFFSLGLGTIGTRQIAEVESTGAPSRTAVARRALFWAALLLSIVGGAVVWIFRDALARHALGGSVSPDVVGWMALAVSLTVATVSQTALLKGLRRVGDVARVSVYSAAVATLFGSLILFVWGREGIPAFVISAPLATFLIGHAYVRRLPSLQIARSSVAEMREQWSVLFRVGLGFMVSAAVAPMGNLLIRSIVQKDLGEDALGQYQAAWLVAMTYLGVVLGAMATDYYPRLTAAIRDRVAANRLVNEQSEVAILLAAPILAAMIGLAPWIIPILYSARFGDAVPVLQWHVLGDVLKVMSWPLGIMILAAGDARMLLFTEVAAVVVYVFTTWIALPHFGIQATGVAFVAMYLLHLPLTFHLARRRTRFAWSPRLRWQFGLALSSCVLIFGVSALSSRIGAAIGIASCLGMLVYAAARIGHLVALRGIPWKVSSACQRLLESIGVSYG